MCDTNAMSELRLAFIRPHARSKKVTQMAMVKAYHPDKVLVFGEHTLADAVKFMRRGKRTLIVPRLSTMDRKRSVVVDAIEQILRAGSSVIEAETGREITPCCVDAVLAGLQAPRHELSPQKAKRSGKMGGARTGYTPEQLEATKKYWQSRELTQANCKKLTGIAYSTLSRHWGNRPVPVKRPVTAGRRPKA